MPTRGLAVARTGPPERGARGKNKGGSTVSFIKKFIEAETISRRNFLLASSYGISGAAALSMFGPSPAMAAVRGAPAIRIGSVSERWRGIS